MFLAFDPHKVTTEMKDATQVHSFQQMASMAVKLIDEVVAKNRATGKEHPFCCHAKHRKTGEIRDFNFDPGYQGRLDHAEALFKGPWCLATDEDVEREMSKRAGAKMDAAIETVRLQEALNKGGRKDSFQFQEAVKTIHAASGGKAPLSAVEQEIQALRERAEKAEKALEAQGKKADATTPAAPQGKQK